MDHQVLHRRARQQGANVVLYWVVRAILQPFFLVYLRLLREGREHLPGEGGVIIAANHRSFLDPFVIATMAKRPMYYVAKQELFMKPGQGWLLNALGAFPVDRGHGDRDMIETAKTILARGDIVLIFPEGTRIRDGSLARPRRGVGRLALESGAPVVPLAVTGTEQVRRGWRIRPRRVRIRAGHPLRFPRVEDPSPALASAVTDRIWPCVLLQWEWLGGLPPIRRAAVIGAGRWGTSLAYLLAEAGLEVELGCRTQEQAEAIEAARENARCLPGVQLPATVRAVRATQLELGGHDLVVLAVPARALPAVIAAHGERITSRSGLLVASRGLVAPLGTAPSAFVAERCRARGVAVLHGPPTAEGLLRAGAHAMVGALDPGFSRPLSELFTRAGLAVSTTTDVTGVELAACAADASYVAATVAAGSDPSVAGLAAGRVFAEVDALARAAGARRGTLAEVGTEDMFTRAFVAAGERADADRERLATGSPPGFVPALGEAAEGIPLLRGAARSAGIDAPTLADLQALLEGRMPPGEWATRLRSGSTTSSGGQTVKAA